MRKKKTAVLLMAVMILTMAFRVTAYAFAQEAEDTADGPVSTEEAVDAENGTVTGGLTPEGNLTLVDDYGERNGEGLQFITLVTKSGNWFYLIIDRDSEGEETVHFLNLVDERDLLTLMDKDYIRDYQEKTDAAQEAEASSRPAEEGTQTEVPEPRKEKKGSKVLPVVIIILLMAGAGVWFFMNKKKKEKVSSVPDPDDYYDDEEEDYAAGGEEYDETGPYGDEMYDQE